MEPFVCILKSCGAAEVITELESTIFAETGLGVRSMN